MQRSSGILLHITSLPGEHGIGDLGDCALKFIDFLRRSNQKLWNILPINPVGPGDSPYAAVSAFAGNPLLISLDILRAEGLLTEQDLYAPNISNEKAVNYEKVKEFKNGALKLAYNSFVKSNNLVDKDNFTRFCDENSYWIEDYSLFMELKAYFGERHWRNWDEDISLHNQEAVKRYSETLKENIEFHKFIQYIFFKQWRNLKEYANKNNIKIIGDIPIYVGDDSCDTWSNRELFQLDEKGIPVVVAGAPPDHYSRNGQRWGNPIYDWDKMEQSGFFWWIRRIRQSLNIYDLVRLDHFRGFEAYWAIPYESASASIGTWIKGPSYKLFDEIIRVLGDVPIIAENLGVITPEIEELRNYYGFPGMFILQMDIEAGFSNNSLPSVYKNSITYTGNHDNNTVLGWFKALNEEKKQFVMKQLKSSSENIVWDIIAYAFNTVADKVIVPMQDFLEQDETFRMNIPGVETGNWCYRIQENQLSEGLAERLGKITHISSR